ncbi:two-component system sensor histidine kinase/response regulator [Bordetella genomosp. 5]|nr:two-component system sensor histidine kinase/response regulator [Bordetella genomosp. 5]
MSVGFYDSAAPLSSSPQPSRCIKESYVPDTLTVAAAGADPRAFLAGGGEAGALLRAHDWRGTRLGDPAGWPQSLKTAVRIMLTSRQPIYIAWGEDFHFLYNDPYQSILGARHPAAMAQPTREVWHEIWHYMEPLLHTAVTRAEGTYEEEKLLIMERNGYPEETYYTFSFTPLPNDDGSIGGIICANSDDTRRVVGDRQLKLLRELATVMPQAADWRDACRLSGEAFAVNPQDIVFGLIYAIEPQSNGAELTALCGAQPDSALAPARLALAEAVWPCAEALRRGEPILVDQLDTRFPGALPANIWERPPKQAALLPIRATSEDEPAFVLVVGLNPLRLYTHEYAHFLDLAAAQIGASLRYARAYEQERRRSEALAEIDRAKTQFFSNISHEFRTPLTLMLAPLEDLLNEATLDPTRLAPVELAHRNGLRLLKLVNALLDFSRIEAGRVQLDLQPTDLSTVTADLAALFRSTMEKAGLAFDIDCPPLPRAVMLDREMWEKVILNLLSNAYKFTYDGGVRVSVRASADGQHAEVEIADTGLGIASEELPRVFDRFHRVAGAQGRSIEGSGIGLALVQEFVRLNGGEVSASSEIGVGTTMALRLPLGPPLHVASDTPARSAPALASAYLDSTAVADLRPDATGVAAQSGSVLVVDDNDDMRAYIGRILLASGYDVEAAPDGMAALAQARRKRPDLILSDVMMPRLDGFGLLAALRADPTLNTVPVLLVSARAGEEASVDGLRAGADDYLIKPFSARELLARVSGNLRLNRLRQESARRLADEARTLEVLNHVGAVVAAEFDMTRAVEAVISAATELTGAALGLLTYPCAPDAAPSQPRLAIAGDHGLLGHHCAARLPAWPTGIGVLRHDDLAEAHVMLPGLALTPRSYLSAPVRGRDGSLMGHLYLVHPEPQAFDERAERLVIGIVAQAAIGIDNAMLYQAAQREIAERARAETALRELNNSLERRIADAVAERDRLWEHSDDLLVICDGEGHLARLSPSWRQRLGYPDTALADQRYGSLVHPDDEAGAGAVFAALRAGAGSQHAEHRLRTATGEWRWVAWTWSFDAAANSIHGVGRDITADKAAAEALREAEEALRVSQKMEAVGQLTGGVAHDFNNLLQVIGGNLQLLQRDLADNPRGQQRARNALAGVERGAKLASQLLAFGRRQPLAPKVINLARFLHDFEDMLRRAVGDGVEVDLRIPADLWHTLADPHQVENALLNLAINARDAMEGHGSLIVAADNVTLPPRDHEGALRPGQYVTLALTDTGCGIDKALLERVFEPFYTTKPEGQGTGLGLSMVYGFVKQTGGHVQLDSAPGRGTTVKLYLPRIEQAEAPVHAPLPADTQGGNETVLVVEDDDAVRATVVDLFTGLGYRVLEARDAQSAHGIFEAGTAVDLLFTDVVMPGPLRSPELARLARARQPDLAVLFTSGYAADAIVHGGRLDEGIDLLSKPYTAAALAQRVRQVLDARGVVQAAARAGAAIAADAVDAAPNPLRDLRVLVLDAAEDARSHACTLIQGRDADAYGAGGVAEAYALLDRHAFQVLVTDPALPDGSGLEVAAAARMLNPALVVLVTSDEDQRDRLSVYPQLRSARQLRKPYTPDQLLDALQAQVATPTVKV